MGEESLDMRKAAMSVIMSIILLAGIVYAATASESHASPAPTATPSAAPSLPACVTEDGAGQALCMWDAQVQGNGVGKSRVSGDCALAPEASDYVPSCLTLHAQPSEDITNDDGSINTIPNGADLVQECNDIDAQGQRDWDVQKQLNKEGWTLGECYKAWL